jgi:hypothetical protein
MLSEKTARMGDKAKPLAAYPPTALLFLGSPWGVSGNAITSLYKERATANSAVLAYDQPFDAS